MEDKLDRLLSDVARLKQALQTRKTPAERAFRLLEKMLAPLAMAVLAFYGNAAADKISAGQLALAKLSVEDKNREFARSLQSKYVELFYADITSGDPVRQGHALGLLRLMDPPLALQLAAFVASSPTAPPALKAQAEATGRQLRREPRAPLRPMQRPSTAVAAPSAPARPR